MKKLARFGEYEKYRSQMIDLGDMPHVPAGN